MIITLLRPTMEMKVNNKGSISKYNGLFLTIVLSICFFNFNLGVFGYDNGLSLTPAMGWNAWNKYGCDVSEDLILQSVKAIKLNGLDKLGYQYINIDDCWQGPSRGPNNEPISDPKKFPRGIKALVDEVHKLGFKVGIYSDAGIYTCGKRFGSLGFEDIDAKAYAEWGIDYLKYDNCYNEGNSGTPEISARRYKRMRDALNSTGRPILYSLCQWGEDGVWNWGSTIANSWRISGDITDSFDKFDDRCPCEGSSQPCALAGFHCSVTNILEKSAGLGQKAGRGGWNDLDMLEVGNGGMSYDEYVTHFSMWAFVKSPLILGNDVTKMSEETLSIIKNSEIIALNQDSANNPGYRIWKRSDPKNLSGKGTIQLWRSDLSDSAYALAFLNLTPNKISHLIDLSEFFEYKGGESLDESWMIKDLWNKNSTINSNIKIIQRKLLSSYNQQTLLSKEFGNSNEFGSKSIDDDNNNSRGIFDSFGSNRVCMIDVIEVKDVPSHGVKVLKLQRVNK